MEAALEAARGLPSSAWLNLNASPRLIIESQPLAQLHASADRQIVLEVTEHEIIEDYERFRAAVDRLGPNVRIAVDDAGSGFASLRHILELRPALVKLDRGLIVGIEADGARRALVAGMQHFAGGTNIRLIAEGVETPAELAVLRELRIQLSQGYLLGRPSSVHGLGLVGPRAASPPGNGNARVRRNGLMRVDGHARANERQDRVPRSGLIVPVNDVLTVTAGAEAGAGARRE